MLAAGNGGLRELGAQRVCRSAALASVSDQYRHFIASSSLGNPASDPAIPTPEAAAAAVAARKTNRAVYWFFGVAAAAVLGTLAYPHLVDLPTSPKPAPLPPPIIPPPSVDLPPPAPEPAVPPREELVKRVETLRAELAELRKQKRSPLVDLKKRGIKDEIALILAGLKRLDKD